MNILILSGSMRSTQGNLVRIQQLSDSAESIDGFCRLVKNDLDNGAHYCNSDVLCGVALLSIRQQRVQAIPFSLATLFRTSDNDLRNGNNPSDIDVLSSKQEEMLDYIARSRGLLLVSPVYFGDRSSVANKLLQMASKTGLFSNKIFGCAAVGAKRNGGQETTVIYCLLEALQHGALIVGNGPPTCQYGGTAVGGHPGTVVSDSIGLATTYGVAKRVTEVAKLHQVGQDSEDRQKVRILILITMDNHSRTLKNLVESYAEDFNRKDRDVHIVVFDTLKHTIYRCLGCKYCPAEGVVSDNENLTLENHARCIIKKSDDAIHLIQKELLKSDAVLIAGLNVADANDIVYRYQVLMERTRYMRRDNFELTNKLFGSFTLHEVGGQSNSLHFVKTVTSYIRHNVPMAKPIDVYTHNGVILTDGKQSFTDFIVHAKALKKGASKVKLPPPEYLTSGIGGYE